MKHIPALDGVRAIAILLVLGFHGYVPLMQGGQIGVDIFFVLSGYLICSLLLNELKATGSISFIRFYIRRALRLYPALLLTLMLVLGYDYFCAKAGYLSEVVFSGLYLMDYAMAFDYVRTFTPLSHTWSLAVEEQFYLVWPPVLLWLWKRYPAEKIVKIVAGATAVSMVWFLVNAWYVEDWLNVYLRFDTRLTGLLLGCLLASCRFQKIRVPCVDEGLMVFTGLLGLWVVAAPHKAAYAPISAIQILLANFFAFFLIAKITDDKPWKMAEKIGSAIPAFIGKISYGVYLFHVPVQAIAVFLLLKSGEGHDWKTSAIMFAGSFMLATFSYYTVEAIARRIGKKYKNQYGDSSA